MSRFRPADMDSSPARKVYHDKLNKLIHEKHQKGERFHYERIVQVESVRSEVIANDQTDAITYQHCECVLKVPERSSVTVHLKQIPAVIETLSFVIVDDREVIIFIPSTDTDSGQLTATRLGTGVFFDDQDGTLTMEMIDLFERIKFYSDPIKKVR